MDVSMITTYLTLIIAIISIVGTLVSIGTVFGLLRGKVNGMEDSLTNLKEKFSTDVENLKQNQDFKVNNLRDTLDDKHSSLSDKINNCFSKVELMDEKYTNLRSYVNIEIKDVNQAVKKIADNYLVRQQNVDSIPDLSERIKKLEIEVGVLPSQLSEELSRAFSDEYKKLVTSLSKNKNNNT